MTVAGSGTKVVKSSGDTEVFDPNIITSDCVEAGVEFWTAAEVALEVSKDVFDGINSDEIQRRIIKALYNRNPEVAERYKRFHSMFVRTSSNTIERFDRKRIVNSLVKETSLPKEVAEIIARETESELRRLNLDFTSGPLIREIVNVMLLEHGYEGARSDYTRLGMPVYDAAQFIERAPKEDWPGSPEAVHKEMANSIFREYSLLKVLPLHLADSHMKGDLHVHGLEYFVTRPYTAFHDIRFILKTGLRFRSYRQSFAGPAKNAWTAALHAIKALLASSENFSSSQGLSLFNVYLSPYLEGMRSDEIRQLAQTCLFEIAQTIPLGDHSSLPVDLEIEYGIPKPLREVPAVLPGGVIKKDVLYRDFEEEAMEFGKALSENYLKGDYSGSPFPSPRLIHRIREDDREKEGYDEFIRNLHEAAAKGRPVNLLNLSTSNLSEMTSAHSTGIAYNGRDSEALDIGEGGISRSSIQLVSINLPRIAYKSGGKERSLYETLDETLAQVREVAEVKREALTRRIKQGALPNFDLLGSSNIVGYVGLNEAMKSYLGEELHKSPYSLETGVSIVRYISERLSKWSKDSGLNWLLSSTANTDVSQRFAMLDSGQFTEVSLTKNYTESCHPSYEAGLSPVERQRLLTPFYNLSSGGLIEKIKVRSKSAEELLELSGEMIKAKAGHWSFESD